MAGLVAHSSQPDPDSGISEAVYQRTQERIKRDRNLRFRHADLAYRQALGLPLNGGLPKQLGVTNGAAANRALHLRATKKMS